MMRSLFSKLKRKLSASRGQTEHPDLKPPSEWGEPQAARAPKTSPTGARSETDAPAIARAKTTEEWLHPDLQMIDTLSVAEVVLEKPPVEPAISFDLPASADQSALAEELEVENGRSERERWKADTVATSASQIPEFPNLADEIDTAELGDKDDELAEEDKFVEQEDELWEAVVWYEVGGAADDGGVRDGSFDSADIGELPEFDPQEIENETESAHWEDLLELELYEEDAEPHFGFIEEEDIVEGRQLHDYAAKLVSHMPSIKLHERARLQSRFKAILEEFPFSASYKALVRLVNGGISLEELEDACEIKCLWREAPWLWSHRRFNRMQRAWETEERLSYRSALTWKLAIELIGRVGRPEAERKIFDDWLCEWRQMQPEQTGEGALMDPKFWSYPLYLQLNHESLPLIDDNLWYYEELPDIQPWKSFRLEDGDGEVWRIETKSDPRDTGFLSILSPAQRLAKRVDAETKEANKKEANSDV